MDEVVSTNNRSEEGHVNGGDSLAGRLATERLVRVFDLAYDCLRQKINGHCIQVDNEASLQLHFAAILKSVGELHEFERNERFSIELEKAVELTGTSVKSGSRRAKIDIVFSFIDVVTDEKCSCAIELKFFKKENHREPNNRYDVFADIHNLENYGGNADHCFMVVATDHNHYVSQETYPSGTGEFDLRDGVVYRAGTIATCRTDKPYGDPITLKNSYQFHWDTFDKGLHFLKLAVEPQSV